MVALIRCGDIEEALTYQRIHHGRRVYSEAWRREQWLGSKPHLALLIDGDDVRWIGRAQGGTGLTTVDRRVSVSEIEEIPLSLQDIREILPQRHKSGLKRTGILPRGLGAAVNEALRTLLPEYADCIERLGRAKKIRLPTGQRGTILNQERDAIGLLLDIGGIGRSPLQDWSTPPTEASFLAGMTGGIAHEDTLILYDTGRFRRWTEVPGVRVEWRAFSNGDKKMFIMNANTKAVEHSLGVDLVYFNESRRSFVLVQYKKMNRSTRDDETAGLWYRPDKNLASELDRMRLVDETFGAIAEISACSISLAGSSCVIPVHL